MGGAARMTLPLPEPFSTFASAKRCCMSMAAAVFLVFFQAYLVAPLIPTLSIPVP